jgi:predicted small secreted protein
MRNTAFFAADQRHAHCDIAGMTTRPPLRIVSLMLPAMVLTGCANTQQAIGGTMMAVGGCTTMIAVGDSMDGHPRNQPDVVSRRGDPSTDIPIAMAGGVLFIVGGIIYLTAPKHHGSTSPPP